MALDNPDLDAVSQVDLEALLAGNASETHQLDFKEASYENGKEFAKDVSAFANTFGGHLVLGATEVDTVITGLPGLKNINVGDEHHKLEQWMETCITPRILGARIRRIDFHDGRLFLIVRVPRSWNPPHQVTTQGHNKFYVRDATRAHEASIEELRMLFSVSATTSDRIEEFRRNRLRESFEQRTPVPLGDGVRVMLHLIPFASIASPMALDLEPVTAQDNLLSPLAQNLGYTPEYNYDGFLVRRGGDVCNGYTLIMRNGVIEATLAGADRRDPRNNRPLLHLTTLFQRLTERLPGYMRAIQLVGLPAPVAVSLSIGNVGGTYLAHSHVDELVTPLRLTDRVTYHLPVGIVQGFGPPDSYQEALRPAFDVLWNASGFPKCLDM
jgi:hypothetical protein